MGASESPVVTPSFATLCIRVTGEGPAVRATQNLAVYPPIPVDPTSLPCQHGASPIRPGGRTTLAVIG